MANSFVVSRAHVAYAVCLPLAVLLGYFLAEPMQSSSEGVLFIVLSVLSAPLLIRWHHPLLIFSWNAAIYLGFMRGQPYLWMAMSFVSLGVAVVTRATSPDAKFITVPSITYPLLFITLVVVATARLTGGMGMRALGNVSYGGKNYFLIGAAIVGYLALSSQRIPANRARLYLSIFFLAGLTSLIPNLLYAAGMRSSPLYLIFPPGNALEQARADYALDPEFVRYQGISGTAQSLVYWLLAAFGLARLCDWKRPLRLLLFAASSMGLLFGGFRSGFLLFALLVTLLFFLEGMFSWRTVLIGLAVGLLALGILAPNANRLPPIVQRTLSFLPLKFKSTATIDAENSSRWRLDMWKALLPTVPKYLLKGKGYGIDPSELAFVHDNERRGYAKPYDWAILAGNYHSGPLSTIIPFGIWGVIGLGWLFFAGIRFLYRSYRFGDPALKGTNTFLLAFFVAKAVMYVFVVGSFADDLFWFTGILGLSVSINGNEAYEAEKAADESSEVSDNKEFTRETFEHRWTRTDRI